MDPKILVQRATPFLGLLALVASGVLALSTLDSGPEQPVAAVSAAKVVALTNNERVGEGITRLERNALLDQAAQMKAEDMAKKGYYAHVSPDGVTPIHWVQRTGYKYLIVGENLVVQRTDAEQVVDAFMGSPGHRANILRKDFTEIGVGVADGTYKGKDATFAVQIFATPYPGSRVSVSESSKVSVKQTAAAPTPAAVTEKPVVATVPRAPAPQPVAPKQVDVGVNTPSGTISAGPIQEKVKVLIKPLLSPLQATTSIASSTASSTTESPLETIRPFFLNEAPPVDIADVSRLETQTPPVPVGSTWTMQFRVFLQNVLLSARGFFS